MRTSCTDCGRPVVAWGRARRSIKAPNPDHDLCQQCWKAQRDRERATVNPFGLAPLKREGVVCCRECYEPVGAPHLPQCPYTVTA